MDIDIDINKDNNLTIEKMIKNYIITLYHYSRKTLSSFKSDAIFIKFPIMIRHIKAIKTILSKLHKSVTIKNRKQCNKVIFFKGKIPKSLISQIRKSHLIVLLNISKQIYYLKKNLNFN